MSQLPPALAAAFRGERPLLVGFVEINLPGYDLLLLDGAAELMVPSGYLLGEDGSPIYGEDSYLLAEDGSPLLAENGQPILAEGATPLEAEPRKFVGRDATYGVLDSIKGLTDSTGDQAPALTLTLIPPTTTALATLLDPAVQGSTVTISIGSVDIATGLVVSPPYVLFAGELDVPTPAWGQRDRRLEYKITSVAERLFATEEGKRLSDAWHQSVWPGETGLSLVTDVETYVPWGQKLDLTAVETRTDMPSMGTMTTKRT